MFDFKDINKLLHYKWNSLFTNCEPKGNKIKMLESEYKKVFNSSICRIAGEVMQLIGNLVLISVILELGDGTVKLAGVSTRLSLFTFIPLLVVLALFGYIILNREKEQTTYFYIGLMALMFIDTIGSIVSLFGFISSLFINPLSGLLGIIAIILVLMGNIGLFSGLIDFCERAKEEYDKNNTVTNMDSEIVMKPIDVNDVSDHTIKKCAYCGNDVSTTANFCKHCGSKL
ncbi:MAG: zinc ribbon domain-containing protein [Bacilli bacterium]|nr:zinc ribbon domain-containing protein [Bacilli bacterium]